MRDKHLYQGPAVEVFDFFAIQGFKTSAIEPTP